MDYQKHFVVAVKISERHRKRMTDKMIAND